MKAWYVRSAGELRRWLEEHHDSERELLIGFYKTSSSKRGIAYQEALDEALCFGWIDGVRRGVDDERYTIRFSPRKPRSVWSRVNVKRVEELTALGRMSPAGLQAFERRNPSQYSYDFSTVELGPRELRAFRKNRQGWEFFQSQAPSYRKLAIWYVISAKKQETRDRRLASLAEYSAKGERLPQAVSPQRRKT